MEQPVSRIVACNGRKRRAQWANTSTLLVSYFATVLRAFGHLDRLEKLKLLLRFGEVERVHRNHPPHSTSAAVVPSGYPGDTMRGIRTSCRTRLGFYKGQDATPCDE